MGSFSKAAAVAGAGLSLASFSPGVGFSSQDLAAFDPSRLAASACGARRAGSALASELLIAQAVAAPASRASPIPLFDDLASSPFPVTTSNTRARRYFSQGLLMTYGFNHSGAVRSFREAQRLDPDCAICWWGEAVALGPNINAPMDERDRSAALAAMDRAIALRERASPLERALIEALTRRYSRDPRADRAALDAAYADAMLDVARRFPADDDVAVLAAEAVMDTSPWNYWEADKKTPVGRSGEAVRLVEAVMARNPAHVQAAHLTIHLLEASDPKRAEAAADRLSSRRAPSAGHLVHMPAHIYYLRGPLRGFDPGQRCGGPLGRGLHRQRRRPQPRALRLLPAQHPLHRHLGPDGRRHGHRDPGGAPVEDRAGSRDVGADRLDRRPSTLGPI